MPKQTKKGGSLELAPLAATSILVAAQKLYKDMMAGEAKKSGKKVGGAKTLRGGMDLPEAAATVVANMTSEELAKYNEQLAKVQAEKAAKEAPAPAPAPATEELLAASEELPAAEKSAAPEELSAAEEPAAEQPVEELQAAEQPQAGGKRKKSKRHGGSAGLGVSGSLDAAAKLEMSAGAKKTKRRGGAEMDSLMPPADPIVATVSGGSKSLRGGNPIPAPMEPMTVGAPIAGGAKKAKSKRGGGGPDMLIPAPNAIATPEIAGGAKKPKSKRHGGSAALEPMMPATTTPIVPEIAGGAKKKKSRGGEFAAYMSQLSKLNDSLSKLM